MPTVFTKEGYRFFFIVTSTVLSTCTVGKEAAKQCSNWKARSSFGSRLASNSQSFAAPRTWQERIWTLLFAVGMSTLVDQPVAAHHKSGKIYVTMASGLELAFPIRGNPRLEGKA